MKNLKTFEEFETTPDFDDLASQAFGRNCGHNADWSVSAYHLNTSQANTNSGDYYLVDNEDDSYSIVQRFYEDDDADLTEEEDRVKELYHTLDPVQAVATAKEFVRLGYDHGALASK